MRVRSACRCLALLLGMVPAPAVAQQWAVEASAGASEYDALSGRTGVANAIFGISRTGPRWLALSTGVPLDSAGVPWLAGGLGMRASRPLARLEMGLEGGALGFGYRVDDLDASGGGATVMALPYVAYSRSSLRLEARTGVMHHQTVFDGESAGRTVSDNALRAIGFVTPRVLVRSEARLVAASDGAFPYVGSQVEMTRGRAAGWLRAGRWLAEDLAESEWGVGGRVALPGRLVLRASFEQQADDPLYWNGARRTWTVGLSRVLGARGASGIELPPPESFRTAPGEVVLQVPFDEAPDGAISIAGDFTGWESMPMRRGASGWEVRLELPPGRYHFSFQRQDGSWFLPASVRNRVDDGFGGTNGVLIVAES